MSKLFYYDVETTGTEFWRNGIHQISGEIEIDGETKEKFDFKVRPNPKAKIEPAALEAGNVTLEQIMVYPPMNDVYVKLVHLLSKYVNKFNKHDKFFQVGYNAAPFDSAFLRAFFKQNGDEFFGSWFWPDVIDVRVIAIQQMQDKRPFMANFQLRTVATALGIVVDESKLHNAEYDIWLTKEVYKILIHGKEKPLRDTGCGPRCVAGKY